MVVNIAPKKANFDLKREVGPLLEKLERKTQRALVELMQEEERERLAADGGIAD
jgi:coiled-coil domain-containing protein 12